MAVFTWSIVGIPVRMDKVSRLRHTQQRIVKVQRRVWLAQVLAWPTAVAAGLLSIAGLVWLARRRHSSGRHEMPYTPGAHEAGTVYVESDGQISRV
ncbi:hypothetical protein [Mycolicibacterium agri]|uniref:Uncharacterized protein n=1 Tax=Mycolicibacterium agri TaxID=36811 RepID=A0A7I9VXR9_MYCAG|nr:hypothetical protein [Mycolicibacterium agri]GFG50110.1 hypothetical protein MAGR_15510 [Mycolicibacterium agri]